MALGLTPELSRAEGVGLDEMLAGSGCVIRLPHLVYSRLGSRDSEADVRFSRDCNPTFGEVNCPLRNFLGASYAPG